MNTKNITKQQIIKAAARVINREGLENTTVDDIAKEAKIAKGSVYSYFKSKDEIFTEAVKQTAQERIDKLKFLLEQFSSTKEKLSVLLKANKKIAKSDPESFLMNYSLLLSTHKNLKKKSAQQFFKSYLDLVEQIMTDGKNKNQIKVKDPKLAAFIIIIVSDLYNVFSFIDPKLVKIIRLRKKLLRMLLNNFT
jgi:AcrR family transcriptional regulator